MVTETYALHVAVQVLLQADYYQPPEEEVEIKSVYLDDMDITDFYWDWIDDRLDDELFEHCKRTTMKYKQSRNPEQVGNTI